MASYCPGKWELRAGLNLNLGKSSNVAFLFLSVVQPVQMYFSAWTEYSFAIRIERILKFGAFNLMGEQL